MTDNTTVLTDRRGAVTWVTINRPDHRNSLNQDVQRGLLESFSEAGEDQDVRVVVLTGAGDKAFCAGGDLGSADHGSGPIQRHFARSAFTDLLRLMSRFGKPIVGAVNGHALAGGMGLAMACDVVVATEDSTFGLPEVNLGLWPMMITPVVVRALGPRKTLELMLTGDRLDAATALSLGAISRVVPRERFVEAVEELAGKLASRSPIAVRLGREAFYAAQDMSFEQALRFLQAQFSVLLQSEDVVEGVGAWFEKREPRWKGR